VRPGHSGARAASCVSSQCSTHPRGTGSSIPPPSSGELYELRVAQMTMTSTARSKISDKLVSIRHSGIGSAGPKPGEGSLWAQRMLTIVGGGTRRIVNALPVPATGTRLITLAGAVPAMSVPSPAEPAGYRNRTNARRSRAALAGPAGWPCH